jgi:anti-sigma-K factor RskA
MTVSDQCLPFLENIPAYALGALDADEAAALEAHLLNCDSCAQELAAYHAVSATLLAAIPPRQPPAALRQRLRGHLSGTQAKTLRPAWKVSFGRLALGLAVLLLVAINIFAVIQLQAVQRAQAQAAQQLQTGQAALAMLAYPDTKSVPINAAAGLTGTLLIDKEHNAAVIILWNLPPLPESQTYQAWLVDPKGDRTSAGLFRPVPGQALTTQAITVTQGLSGFTGLGVTVEPAGGAPTPTGPRLFKVDF